MVQHPPGRATLVGLAHVENPRIIYDSFLNCYIYDVTVRAFAAGSQNKLVLCSLVHKDFLARGCFQPGVYQIEANVRPPRLFKRPRSFYIRHDS